MFNDGFNHYLGYGATDQETIRELLGRFDGLVVPGTVAAFQHQGTGGFVLALSATVQGAPYVIDPRFPLFQRALPEAKRSHLALATALGAPHLVRPTAPAPTDFSDELVRQVARSWVQFNESYRGSAGSKFDKYAKRLNESVVPEEAERPLHLLAPYCVAEGPQDAWWDVSTRLFRATLDEANSVPPVRVVAATSPGALQYLLREVDEERIVIWVSNLNELEATTDELATYLSAIYEASQNGRLPFALYGGFFSVLCHGVGLRGAKHGIGFGEFRSWPELPRSGPAPARFYLAALHRYVSQEDAQRITMAVPTMEECQCTHCSGRSPIELEYHDLMKHSVECRATEIQEWANLSLSAMADRLEDELDGFLSSVISAEVSDLLWRRVERYSDHIPTWASAIRAFLSS